MLEKESEVKEAVNINRFFADRKASKEISIDDVMAAVDASVGKNENGVRVLKNTVTGETATLSNSAISKMFSSTSNRLDSQNIGGILGKEAIANIGSIFDTAILVKTTPDAKHGTKNRILRYANVIRSDGENFIVKMTVKEIANKRPELTDIEIEDNGGKDLSAYDMKVGRKNTAEGNISGDKSPTIPNGTDITINDLIDFVNAYSEDSIQIDGKSRAARNSLGRRIARTEEGLRAFYKWFGDSKAVDEQGRPLVVYHGTYAEFDTFDKEKIGGAHDQGFYGRGFYFSRYKGEARSYGSKVMPVYLKISKPFDLEGVDSGKYSGMNNIFEKGAILLRQLGLLDEEQLKKLDFYEKTKKDFLNKIEVFPPSENQDVWFGEVESPSGQKILERAWESDNTKDGLIDVLWNKYTRYIKYDDGTYFQYILDGLSFTGFMRDDGYRPNEFTEKLEKLGYDGVYQGDEFVVFEPNQIKSVENRGSFSPESDNIYYQFAGENALTADMSSLEQAKAMDNSGADAETIRKQTGWFKGADSKWRFEISDKDAKINSGVLENISSLDNLYAKREQLLSDIKAFEKERKTNAEAYLDGYLDDLISKRYDEIEKIDYDISHGYVSDPETTLGELLKHDKLYAAYPSLKNMTVKLRTSKDLSNGGYSRKENTIYLDSRLDENEIKSTLMHEIQHVIQDKENFSRGGNMELAKAYKKIIKAKEAKDFHKALDRKIAEAMVERLKADNFSDKDASIIAGAYAKYFNAIFDDSLDGDVITKIEKEYYQLLDNLGIEPDRVENAYKAIQGRDLWQEALDETKSKLSEADTFEIYRAFAGEVEARNTQARMNMSDEERAATSVESTQDIKNADALVVFPDGTEAAYIPENVRVEDGVVDLSEAFDKTPTIDEVKKYINKICEESKEFATLSPDWIVKAPKGAYRKGHIIYSDKWREMSNAQKERHNKFVLALSEILDNAVYLNSLPNKKTENPKKKNVTNYHYLGATVKIGTETYDVIFDTEQFKDDKINNPRKVSLYNVYEKEKSPFGKSTLASKNPIGNFNKNILQKEDVVNNAYQTGELGLEGGREKAPFGAQAQSQKEKVIYQVFGQYEPAKKLITLFQGKNSTTLVHELLHHYLPIYLTELEKAGKFEQLKGLYEALGVQSYSDIARQRAKMEQLIDLGTSYIYYNESPNEASRSLFERAKQWMLDAYNIVKKFVKPSKEVDEYFNVELHTEQIKGQDPNLLYLYHIRVKRNPAANLIALQGSYKNNIP